MRIIASLVAFSAVFLGSAYADPPQFAATEQGLSAHISMNITPNGGWVVGGNNAASINHVDVLLCNASGNAGQYLVTRAPGADPTAQWRNLGGGGCVMITEVASLQVDAIGEAQSATWSMHAIIRERRR